MQEKRVDRSRFHRAKLKGVPFRHKTWTGKEAKFLLKALRGMIHLEVRIARNDIVEKIAEIEKTLEIIARDMGRCRQLSA
jgi:hypothetical protein